MAMRERIILSWSGGKDSTMALYRLKAQNEYEIAALLTTITEDYDRVSMHGIRRVLIEEQADSLGIHLEKVFISKDDSNENYEREIKKTLLKYSDSGIKSVVFGDIFLEDLKIYRERNLSKIGMKGVFPIWKEDTKKLANEFINLGFKSFITCVDTKYLDKDFVGRSFDSSFIRDLPKHVDPCGENGEFHSFVYDGPIFKRRIFCTLGEKVLRDERFYYCDLLPKNEKKDEKINSYTSRRN